MKNSQVFSPGGHSFEQSIYPTLVAGSNEAFGSLHAHLAQSGLAVGESIAVTLAFPVMIAPVKFDWRQEKTVREDHSFRHW